LPNVDAKRIGLVGFSLGAYLALAAAAEKDLRIAAVVDFFGGMPRPLGSRVKFLPPVLVLHGEQDRVVPIGEAQRLTDLLDAHEVTHEVKVYPDVGHVFGDNGGGFAWRAALDAELCTRAFLAKHLQQTAAPVAAPR
jgi:carboxymethylenebutenolidase